MLLYENPVKSEDPCITGDATESAAGSRVNAGSKLATSLPFVLGMCSGVIFLARTSSKLSPPQNGCVFRSESLARLCGFFSRSF